MRNSEVVTCVPSVVDLTLESEEAGDVVSRLEGICMKEGGLVSALPKIFPIPRPITTADVMNDLHTPDNHQRLSIIASADSCNALVNLWRQCPGSGR